MDKFNALLAAARNKRAEYERFVTFLEELILETQTGTPVNSDPAAALVKRTSRRKARMRKSPSVPTLTETLLRAHPEGMMTPQLMAELRKLGYESRSKNPPNTLNSILRGSVLFKRLADGRWTLADSAKVNNSNGSKEETAIH
jgi:hypothetical protein